MIGKMIHLTGEVTQEMVANEISIMMMNQGQDIIECYDSLEHTPKPSPKEPHPKKQLWMMMEPMSGDMEKVINYCNDTNYEYGEDFISYVCYRTIQGINFLHKQKIVHRDIKSDNVLYNYKGEIKLADFGFAVTLTEEKNMHNDVMGTLLYMAPELCSGENYALSVDIWSFGIMCLELAFKRRPHEDVVPFPDEPLKILELIKKGTPKLDKK